MFFKKVQIILKNLNVKLLDVFSLMLFKLTIILCSTISVKIINK